MLIDFSAFRTWWPTAAEKHRRYLFPCVTTYYESPLTIVRGEGMHVWDDAGRLVGRVPVHCALPVAEAAGGDRRFGDGLTYRGDSACSGGFGGDGMLPMRLGRIARDHRGGG